MVERRYSRIPYFVGLAGLLGTQFFAFQQLESPWLAVLVLQLIKVPLTVWRLNDLARSPDDSLWTVVPVANVALAWICLTTATPSAEKWERLRGRWYGQISAFGAFSEGAKLCGQTAVLGGGAAVGYGVISALVSYRAVRLLETFQEWDAGQLAAFGQALWGLSGLLTLYTVLQFMKRKTASRASWFPSLFLLPSILLSITVSGVSSGMHQSLGLLFLNLPWQAWGLVWQSIGGAALAIIWIRLAQASRDGQPLPFGGLVRELRGRLADVAGAHGARVHAVLVGMQVLIPGIFYALQLAFTDMVAVLHPDRPALAGSGQLSWGIRRRLFKVFAIWLLMSFTLSVGGGLLVESAEVMQEAFLDLRAMSLVGVLVQDVIWILTTWWLEMALLVIFWERVERLNWTEVDSTQRPADAVAQ